MDAFTPPQLPGLVVRRPLGDSADPPWLAKADDGSWVVVRRAPRPPDLPESAALVAVYGAVTDDAGESWVISAYTAGSGLDQRLERVGLLEPSLAVAWGAVLCQALAVLHESGLVHGDLRPSRVLLGHRDTVLLDATCARAGGSEEAEADVRALVEVLAAAGGDPAEGPLAAAVAASRVGSRDARELASTWAHVRRERVGSAWSDGRGTRSLRLLAGAAGAVALLGGAAVLGTQLAQPPEVAASLSAGAQSPSPAGTTAVDGSESARPPVEPDWAEILAALDRQRGRAFAAADPRLLGAVDAPGSQAHARDLVVVKALAAGQVTAHGWATSIGSVAPSAVTVGRVELIVEDSLAAYDLVDAAGTIVAHQPPRSAATWSIILVATAKGWLIESVATAGP